MHMEMKYTAEKSNVDEPGRHELHCPVIMKSPGGPHMKIENPPFFPEISGPKSRRGFWLTVAVFIVNLIPAALPAFDWNSRLPAVMHFIVGTLLAEAFCGIAALPLMFLRRPAGWMLAVGLTAFRATYCVVTLLFFHYFTRMPLMIAVGFSALLLFLLNRPDLRVAFRAGDAQFWNAVAIGFAFAAALCGVLLFGMI